MPAPAITGPGRRRARVDRGHRPAAVGDGDRPRAGEGKVQGLVCRYEVVGARGGSQGLVCNNEMVGERGGAQGLVRRRAAGGRGKGWRCGVTTSHAAPGAAARRRSGVGGDVSACSRPVLTPLPPPYAGQGKQEAKDFMGGFGLGSVVEQLADLKLGELLDSPPPGFDEAVAISKVRREGCAAVWGSGAAGSCRRRLRAAASTALLPPHTHRPQALGPAVTVWYRPRLPPRPQVLQFVKGEEYARFSRIVFDTAPTGHTLRLLTVPGTSHGRTRPRVCCAVVGGGTCDGRSRGCVLGSTMAKWLTRHAPRQRWSTPGPHKSACRPACRHCPQISWKLPWPRSCACARSCPARRRCGAEGRLGA